MAVRESKNAPYDEIIQDTHIWDDKYKYENGKKVAGGNGHADIEDDAKETKRLEEEKPKSFDCEAKNGQAITQLHIGGKGEYVLVTLEGVSDHYAKVHKNDPFQDDNQKNHLRIKSFQRFNTSFSAISTSTNPKFVADLNSDYVPPEELAERLKTNEAINKEIATVLPAFKDELAELKDKALKGHLIKDEDMTDQQRKDFKEAVGKNDFIGAIKARYDLSKITSELSELLTLTDIHYRYLKVSMELTDAGAMDHSEIPVKYDLGILKGDVQAQVILANVDYLPTPKLAVVIKPEDIIVSLGELRPMEEIQKSIILVPSGDTKISSGDRKRIKAAVVKAHDNQVAGVIIEGMADKNADGSIHPNNKKYAEQRLKKGVTTFTEIWKDTYHTEPPPITPHVIDNAEVGLHGINIDYIPDPAHLEDLYKKEIITRDKLIAHLVKYITVARDLPTDPALKPAAEKTMKEEADEVRGLLSNLTDANFDIIANRIAIQLNKYLPVTDPLYIEMNNKTRVRVSSDPFKDAVRVSVTVPPLTKNYTYQAQYTASPVAAVESGDTHYRINQRNSHNRTPIKAVPTPAKNGVALTLDFKPALGSNVMLLVTYEDGHMELVTVNYDTVAAAGGTGTAGGTSVIISDADKATVQAAKNAIDGYIGTANKNRTTAFELLRPLTATDKANPGITPLSNRIDKAVETSTQASTDWSQLPVPKTTGDIASIIAQAEGYAEDARKAVEDSTNALGELTTLVASLAAPASTSEDPAITSARETALAQTTITGANEGKSIELLRTQTQAIRENIEVESFAGTIHDDNTQAIAAFEAIKSPITVDDANIQAGIATAKAKSSTETLKKLKAKVDELVAKAKAAGQTAEKEIKDNQAAAQKAVTDIAVIKAEVERITPNLPPAPTPVERSTVAALETSVIKQRTTVAENDKKYGDRWLNKDAVLAALAADEIKLQKIQAPVIRQDRIDALLEIIRVNEGIARDASAQAASATTPADADQFNKEAQEAYKAIAAASKELVAITNEHRWTEQPTTTLPGFTLRESRGVRLQFAEMHYNPNAPTNTLPVNLPDRSTIKFVGTAEYRMAVENGKPEMMLTTHYAPDDFNKDLAVTYQNGAITITGDLGPVRRQGEKLLIIIDVNGETAIVEAEYTENHSGQAALDEKTLKEKNALDQLRTDADAAAQEANENYETAKAWFKEAKRTNNPNYDSAEAAIQEFQLLGYAQSAEKSAQSVTADHIGAVATQAASSAGTQRDLSHNLLKAIQDKLDPNFRHHKKEELNQIGNKKIKVPKATSITTKTYDYTNIPDARSAAQAACDLAKANSEKAAALKRRNPTAFANSESPISKLFAAIDQNLKDADAKLEYINQIGIDVEDASESANRATDFASRSTKAVKKLGYLILAKTYSDKAFNNRKDALEMQGVAASPAVNELKQINDFFNEIDGYSKTADTANTEAGKDDTTAEAAKTFADQAKTAADHSDKALKKMKKVFEHRSLVGTATAAPSTSHASDAPITAANTVAFPQILKANGADASTGSIKSTTRRLRIPLNGRFGQGAVDVQKVQWIKNLEGFINDGYGVSISDDSMLGTQMKGRIDTTTTPPTLELDIVGDWLKNNDEMNVLVTLNNTKFLVNAEVKVVDTSPLSPSDVAHFKDIMPKVREDYNAAQKAYDELPADFPADKKAEIETLLKYLKYSDQIVTFAATSSTSTKENGADAEHAYKTVLPSTGQSYLARIQDIITNNPAVVTPTIIDVAFDPQRSTNVIPLPGGYTSAQVVGMVELDATTNAESTTYNYQGSPATFSGDNLTIKDSFDLHKSQAGTTLVFKVQTDKGIVYVKATLSRDGIAVAQRGATGPITQTPLEIAKATGKKRAAAATSAFAALDETYKRLDAAKKQSKSKATIAYNAAVTANDAVTRLSGELTSAADLATAETKSGELLTAKGTIATAKIAIDQVANEAVVQPPVTKPQGNGTKTVNPFAKPPSP